MKSTTQGGVMLRKPVIVPMSQYPSFERAGVSVDTIVPRRYLQKGTTVMWCPYCQHSWDRGGHAEGFRVSAAHNHIAQCHAILVFERGYMPYGHGRALTLTDYQRLPNQEHVRHQLRLMRASIAKRKRQGLTPRVPK